MEASVDPQCRGPDWMPITPKTGSLFHAETHRADVHQTYLSGVETGKRNPSVEVLSRIAAALSIDIEELFRVRRGR